MRILIVSEPNTIDLFTTTDADLREKGYQTRHFLHDGSAVAPNLLFDADALLAYGRFRCDRAMMASAPRLRAVVSPWVGTEGFDETAATELGIIVANGQAREHIESMAEAAVMLMLACAFDLNGAQTILRESRPRPSIPAAELLHGKTVGLVGFGRIGRRVAQLIAGWGMNIQAYDPTAASMENVNLVPLDELLETSNIVTIHAILTPETRHLFNSKTIGRMKRDAILINTSRGEIVDQQALCEYLRAGHLRAVALDVFEEEPLPADDPLRQLPNAILTPHMVGQTKQSRHALPKLAIENLSHALSGSIPPCVRNPAVIPRWLDRWGPGKRSRAADEVPS